jgi:hypothetical protein
MKGRPSPMKGRKLTKEHIERRQASRMANGGYIPWNKKN